MDAALTRVFESIGLSFMKGPRPTSLALHQLKFDHIVYRRVYNEVFAMDTGCTMWKKTKGCSSMGVFKTNKFLQILS